MRFKRNKNRFAAPRRLSRVANRPPGTPHRGVYLLPNLFTTAALFSGFYGIVMAMDQQFTAAAVAIFAAMVLDSLDGRVARMTNTQSAFGAEYDSLADMVSFGAAPALIIYEWSLSGMGKWGWVAAFVYLAGACAVLLPPPQPRPGRGEHVSAIRSEEQRELQKDLERTKPG